MKINYIKIMKLLIRDSKGVINTINIMESDSVEELKKQIKEKNNITGEIELVFNGIILDNDQNLAELDIKDGNTIDYLGQYNAGIYKL